MALSLNPVSAKYLGGQRAEVRSGSRHFIVDQRANVGQPGAQFCPLELITAALAS